MMRLIVCALSLCALASLAQARPRVLHEVQYLPFPAGQGAGAFTNAIAMDGNDVISLHSEYVEQPDGSERLEHYALWFELDAGFRWQFRGRLLTEAVNAPNYWPSVSLKNGVAAIGTQPMVILERNATGWTRHDITSNYPDGNDIDVDAGGVLGGYGRCGWDARYFEKQGATWGVTGTITGAQRTCNPQQNGENLALSGPTALVFNRYIDGQDIDEARIYRKPASGSGPWPQIATLAKPEGEISFYYGHKLDLLGNLAMISGTHRFGTHVFRDLGAGNWQRTGAMRSFRTPVRSTVNGLQLDDGLQDRIALQWHDGDFAADVYRENFNGQFVYDSLLWPRGGPRPDLYTNSGAVDGFNVVLANGYGLYFFIIAETHEGIADDQQWDFNNAYTGGWAQSSNYFWVARDMRAGGYVWRQAWLSGESTAWTEGMYGTDQSIEADIRPTEFQANDRWVGLMTRRRDATTYYYATLRYPGTLALKRMVNGQFVSLASRSFNITVTPGRNYRMRLESIGTRHRIYLDGQVALELFDDVIESGAAGLITYRARADYDNVVVSLRPQLESFADPTVASGAYQTNGSGSWNEGSGYALTQSSVAGIARLFVTDPVFNQAIEARITPQAFATGTGSRWYGLMTRYVDENNYYYMTVRNNGEVSLRKLLNGQIHVLDTATVTLPAGATHHLRLEMVGDRLRAYANGELLAYATDTSHIAGGSGIATYRAQATFDEVRAYQY